jgi:hypothetical protein
MKITKQNARLVMVVVFVVTCVAIVIIRRIRAARNQEAERQCVANMALIWSAAVGYAMENNLSLNTAVSVADFREYTPLNKSFKCPLSDREYRAFVIVIGPTCPNSDAHTHARQPNPKLQ